MSTDARGDPPHRRKRAVTPGDFAEKRQVILAAALAEYVRVGFAEARVEHIAKAAGVGKGTIYTYFRSKEDILVAVLDRYTEPLVLSLEEATGKVPARDGKARLRALVDLMSAYSYRNPQEIVLQSNALYGLRASGGHMLSVRMMRDWVERYREFFAEHQVLGQVRTDTDPEILAVLFLCLMHSYNRLPTILGYHEQIATDVWCSLLVDVWWRGIAPLDPLDPVDPFSPV